MTPRIKRAIDVFLDAINNGTLAKGDCCACAVGNLCADAIGYKIEPSLIGDFRKEFLDTPNSKWGFLFMTNSSGEQSGRSLSELQVKLGLELISKTEFTEEELREIEYTFETNTKILCGDYSRHSTKEIRADQIKGLEAVVKVMLEFDDCKEDTKEVFTKRAKLIPIA